LLKAKHKSQGITLIELLVTLAVMAIISGIGLPSYNAIVNEIKLTGLTQQLVEALRVTKQLAITRDKTQYLSVNLIKPGRCWGISSQPVCNCSVPSSSSCALENYRISTDYSTITLNTNRDTLSFSPLSGSTNGASYTLSAGAGSVKVKVSTLGRISACSETGDSTLYANCE
jgi:type IV fimbrial biogenesis protein FimT